MPLSDPQRTQHIWPSFEVAATAFVAAPVCSQASCVLSCPVAAPRLFCSTKTSSPAGTTATARVAQHVLHVAAGGAAASGAAIPPLLLLCRRKISCSKLLPYFTF